MGRGGQNQTHARLERVLKLDSFMVGNISGSAAIRWPSGNSVWVQAASDVVLLLYRYQGREIREPVAVSRVPNNYGHARPFLLCPGCGRRVRYLYLRWGRFRCRSCARLNYASQQTTKDEFLAYKAAVKLLRERFKTPKEQIPDPMELPYFIPKRPKGMRRTTYWGLLERYGALRNQYESEFCRRASAVLRRWN